MAKILTEYTNGKKPMPIAVAQEEVVVRKSISILAAQLLAGNVFSFFSLPADHVLVGYTLRSDDLDTNGTPLVTLDLGIINAAANGISTDVKDGGAKLVSASTLAQAGGLLVSTASAAAWKQVGLLPAQAYDREFGVAVLAAPATAAAGDIEMEIRYRPA